jgi:hypothetical protein
VPVAAVAQGDDPSLAHREHAVDAVSPTSAEMGVNPWRPHADHDQLAVAGDLLELGPQAVLGPVPQHTLVPSTRRYGSRWAAASWMASRSTPSSSAHRSSGAAIGRDGVGSWASQAGMPGRVDEQVFEEQQDESSEHPVHDIDIRRQSDAAIPHVPSSFGEEFSSDSSGALRAAAARPSSVAEPRTAGAPQPQHLPAARPHRPVDALLASVSGGWGEQER